MMGTNYYAYIIPTKKIQSMNKEKLKDLIFTAQCAIGEYIATTLDDDLLDKACDLLEEALKELND